MIDSEQNRPRHPSGPGPSRHDDDNPLDTTLRLFRVHADPGSRTVVRGIRIYIDGLNDTAVHTTPNNLQDTFGGASGGQEGVAELGVAAAIAELGGGGGGGGGGGYCCSDQGGSGNYCRGPKTGEQRPRVTTSFGWGPCSSGNSATSPAPPGCYDGGSRVYCYCNCSCNRNCTVPHGRCNIYHSLFRTLQNPSSPFAYPKVNPVPSSHVRL